MKRLKQERRSLSKVKSKIMIDQGVPMSSTREEYAKQLRKKKTNELIEKKRRIQSQEKSDYTDFQRNKKRNEELRELMLAYDSDVVSSLLTHVFSFYNLGSKNEKNSTTFLEANYRSETTSCLNLCCSKTYNHRN